LTQPFLRNFRRYRIGDECAPLSWTGYAINLIKKFLVYDNVNADGFAVHRALSTSRHG
jgi:hypothetical protein